MKITTNKVQSFDYFELQGQMNNKGIIKLQSEVEEAMKRGSKFFVFDFSNLSYINSSGLRIFIKTQKQLKLFDGFLTIFAVEKEVKEILDISELNELLRVKPSLKEAIAEIR